MALRQIEVYLEGRNVLAYVDEPEAPGASPEAGPVADAPPMGDAGPPEGYDEWLMHFEYFLANDPRGQAMLGGGGETSAPEMPPEGELGEPAEPAMPEPGMQNSIASKLASRGVTGAAAKASAKNLAHTAGAGIKGAAGSAGRSLKDLSQTVGRGINAHPMLAAGATAGAGTAAGGLGGFAAGRASKGDPVPHQNGTAPVGYQAEMASLKRTVASQQAFINQLASTNAVKDAELQVQYLANLGVVDLYTADRTSIDGEKYKQRVGELAAMPPDHRQAKVEEIATYWEKDASIAYAAAGAPVGRQMIGVVPSQNGGPVPGAEDAPLTQYQGEQILEEVRKNPGQDSWAKAKAKVLGKK